MKVYSVWEPPALGGTAADRAERFVFVHDGFSGSAFVFAPIWLLWHRLWFALIAYGCVVAALGFGLRAVGVSAAVRGSVWVLLHLLIGFEASSLWRASLRRRGWRDLDVVVADDLEAAERRFFSSWVLKANDKGSVPPSPSPALPRMPQSTDVVGLFPKPGASR
jgi:Protein of unknown function (DUF2628)